MNDRFGEPRKHHSVGTCWCGELHASEHKDEKRVLNAVAEMFPDFDFSGCYDLGDLLNHAQGQLANEREVRETERDTLREAICEALTITRHVAALASAGSQRETVEGREGIVTVYDHEGRYLGCMGIESWRDQLASAGSNE